jgi:glycosyltransferase involved in cell wall biosynthesis
MKILFVAATARSLLNFRGPLIREILNRGCEVLAAAPFSDVEVKDTLSSWGVSCFNLGFSRSGLNPLADFVACSQLVSLMRRERPEVVFAYTHKPVIYSGVAGLFTDCRVFGLVSGLGEAFSDNSRGRMKVAQKMLSLLYRIGAMGLKGIVFQNTADQKEFVERGIISERLDSTVVNGSGVDLSHFVEKPFPQGPAHFVLLSRLIEQKGIRDFAAAAAIVKRTRPDALFSLAGPFEQKRQCAISANEVSGWVRDGLMTYHGSISDVRELLAAATVCVLPSFYREGIPRSLLEALATGRAVITCNTVGCREVVEVDSVTVVESGGIMVGENGFLIPPRRPEVLADVMLRLITNEELTQDMGKKSRLLAEKRFDVLKVNEEILSFMKV